MGIELLAQLLLLVLGVVGVPSALLVLAVLRLGKP